jgi:hypothetical protein
MLLDNGGKSYTCYKVCKQVAEYCLLLSVLCKVGLVNLGLGCLAENVSKQSVERTAWFL